MFGIDTEHHHQRSFRGFLCLIQISTRDENYILDPLAPGLHWRDVRAAAARARAAGATDRAR